MPVDLREAIKGDNFLIVVHQKPDGDCLGSALAFSNFLNRENKKNQIIIKDIVPKKFDYLPGSEQIVEFSEGDAALSKKSFDVVVFLDCATLEMSGFKKEDFTGKKIINIDHHPTNPNYGDINLINANASATSEILFDLFEEEKIKLDKKIAINLFSGIFTDTGGFQHSNTNLKVLQKAAELQSFGVNVGKISKTVFMTKSIGSLKVLGLALSRLKYNQKHKIVYSVISVEDQKKLKTNEDDLEGISTSIAKCPGVNAAMFIYQTEEGNIKGSLRTEKDNVDVSALASALCGGGHKKASGFKFKGKIINRKDGWAIV